MSRKNYLLAAVVLLIWIGDHAQAVTKDSADWQRIIGPYGVDVNYRPGRNKSGVISLPFHDPFFDDDSATVTMRERYWLHKITDSLLAPYKGSVVYLDFWATWCGHCIEEFRGSTQRLQQHYAGKKVAFIYVNMDDTWDSAAVAAYVQALNVGGKHVTWRSLLDRLPEGVTGFPAFLPTYMLFDKQGHLVNDDAPRPSQPKDLYPKIDSLLNGQKD